MLDTREYVVAALLEEGTISADSLAAARDHARLHGVAVIDALIACRAVSRERVAITRATIIECTYVDAANYDVDIRNALLMPRSVAERHTAFPLFDIDGVVTMGMADPLDLSAVDQIRGLLRAEIDPVLCDQEALRNLITRAYSLTSQINAAVVGAAADQQDLVTGEEPIVAAVNQILAQAAHEGVSDIHINPDENDLTLRFRIDGSLQPRHGPPKSAHAGIVQRLKVLANLDLTQTRRPQDGKFRFTHDARPVDVRVSIIPTIHGENVVLRLLASGTSIRGFPELGLSPSLCEQLNSTLDNPYGIFLATGPTGSGKTTTLYTALKRINTPDRNVMTIEDPVEIRLPMVRQVQVNTEIGLTFAAALRAILRQDPDVVLLGEIRDSETARIALQAALTGHLVLATLHTSDAAGAISRLRDLDCPAFAINASLLGILAQRLVKKVCMGCAKPYEPAQLMLDRFGLCKEDAVFVKGAGCPGCMSSGYRGRVTIAEFLRISAEIKRLIEREAGTADVQHAALLGGMKPMWQDGVEKAKLGITTLEEVSRAAIIDLDDLWSESPASRGIDGAAPNLRVSA